jgi:hypothetical protein
MGEFFSTQFSLQNLLIQLMWAYITTAFIRLLAWLFRVSLQGQHRELAFWFVVPGSLLVLTLFLTQATGHTKAPWLTGHIDAAAVGGPDAAAGATVTLIASVRNLGAPSVVEGWSLSVELPTRQTFSGQPFHVPERVTLHHEGGATVSISGEDALANKTVPTPLQTGGMQRGVLLFRFDQLARQSISQPGTKLILYYHDVTGKRYSTEAALGAIQKNFSYFPGLRIYQ